mmetsp:Transcript_47812/g.149903  ORF Transcript_47812/g.149903 Transcript_47812/m.149903 type:complete len:207 (-) Transcript_47812:2020-2640(-)
MILQWLLHQHLLGQFCLVCSFLPPGSLKLQGRDLHLSSHRVLGFLDLGQDVPLMLLCDPLADLSLQRVLLLYIVDFSHHTLLLLHSELSFSPVLLDSLLQLFTTRLKHLLHQLLACRPLFLPHLLAFAPGLLLLCLSDRLACRLIHGFFLHKFNELRLVLPGLLTQLRLVLQLGLLCTPFFVQHGIKQFQVFFLLASDFCVLLSSQ